MQDERRRKIGSHSLTGSDFFVNESVRMLAELHLRSIHLDRVSCSRRAVADCAQLLLKIAHIGRVKIFINVSRRSPLLAADVGVVLGLDTAENYPCKVCPLSV